jgi:ABC-type amino acid transport substrate-binding protein
MLRLVVLILCLGAAPAAAQDTSQPMLIGTREAPPFVMKTALDRWEGISIDLLAALSERLGFEYRLVEVDLPEMISEVADGRLDASMAAMTITAAREALIDFSHPFYRTGLGVAVSANKHTGWWSVLDVLSSREFMTTIGLLAGLLFGVGALAWVVERRRNPGHFEPDPPRGLFSGIWWAAVTMSTVGYGDKAPITLAGRLLGMAWMFVALILTAVFTAQLTAGLTATSINSPVQTLGDLPRVRVGNLVDSASVEPLRTIGVRPLGFPSVEAGLEALAEQRIEAFVHDATILAWQAGAVNGVRVTALEFAPQDYGIVLPPGTPFRETVNRALLEVLASDEWRAIQRRYLGE